MVIVEVDVMKTSNYLQRLISVFTRVNPDHQEQAATKEAELLFHDEYSISDVDDFCDVDFLTPEQCQQQLSNLPEGNPKILGREDFLNLLPVNGYMH